MNVFAFHANSDFLQVCGLHSADQVVFYSNCVKLDQGDLLPALQREARKAQEACDHMQYVVFSNGPASFTTLRALASFGLGYAHANDAKIVNYTTFDIMNLGASAYSAQNNFQYYFVDSRADYYFSYDVQSGETSTVLKHDLPVRPLHDQGILLENDSKLWDHKTPTLAQLMATHAPLDCAIHPQNFNAFYFKTPKFKKQNDKKNKKSYCRFSNRFHLLHHINKVLNT